MSVTLTNKTEHNNCPYDPNNFLTTDMTLAVEWLINVLKEIGNNKHHKNYNNAVLCLSFFHKMFNLTENNHLSIHIKDLETAALERIAGRYADRIDKLTEELAACKQRLETYSWLAEHQGQS